MREFELYHSPTDALNLFYCDHYSFPLPPSHKFPLPKYRLLREELTRDNRFSLQPARYASRDALVRVHSERYVDDFLTGKLDPMIMRRIGFPWSPQLVQRTLASVGGTLLAARAALEKGFGGNLAGGTHHACKHEGAGFCVFNDIAVAIAWARAEKRINRAAVVDLDVHQGDGTAAIFANDDAVYTLSLHAARNFPLRKQTSRLDIELADGTGDNEYLSCLEESLKAVWHFRPELLIFQSGVDTLACDRLGRLSLSLAGLAQRDALVITSAHELGIPLVITLGGGYSSPIQQTVSAHAQTFRIAADIYAAEP